MYSQLSILPSTALSSVICPNGKVIRKKCAKQPDQVLKKPKLNPSYMGRPNMEKEKIKIKYT